MEWTGTTVPSESVPAFTASEDLRHDLAQALATLSTEEQAAIHLCYGEGLSHREAAAVLGSPLDTVKTHVLRAKDKLRIQLRTWAPDSSQNPR